MTFNRYSSLSAAVSVVLHVALVVIVSVGLLQHSHHEIDKPPVIIELVRPKQEPPPPPPKPEPPKPEPPKPEPPKPKPLKPEPVQPEPPRPAPPVAAPPKPDLPKSELPKLDSTQKLQTESAQIEKHSQIQNEASKKGRGHNASASPDPAFQSRFQAAYDSSSMIKRFRLQGTVVFNFLVRADGSIDTESIKVKSSSGSQRLDEFALEILKKSPKFSPEIKDGEAIDAVKDLPITFKLPY